MMETAARGSETGYPWQTAYYLSGLLALAAMFWLYRYEFPAFKVDEKMEWSVLQSILKNRRFLLLCAAIVLYVGTETSVWGWTPKYLMSELNYEASAAAV